MMAAMLGRHDIAELLINGKADIDKQDTKSGWTALMQATFHRYLQQFTFSVASIATKYMYILGLWGLNTKVAKHKIPKANLCPNLTREALNLLEEKTLTFILFVFFKLYGIPSKF